MKREINSEGERERLVMERSQRLSMAHSPEVRGERGMLSGTSKTSHMLFLKDAWR